MLKCVQIKEVNTIALMVIELLQLGNTGKGDVLQFQTVKYPQQRWFYDKAFKSNKRVKTY